jgi:hypothetical protein
MAFATAVGAPGSEMFMGGLGKYELADLLTMHRDPTV